jgi:uncharacterized repeat protein (TIGR01451 family)
MSGRVEHQLARLGIAAAVWAAGCVAAAAQAMMLVPGQFNVSPSGGANYSVGVVVPPGTAGVVPVLSLDYSSQGGDGVLGMGWSLGGLPSIGRCQRTIAQDGVRGAVNYDANDRFCMGGQRLFAINNGGYGADGTEYRTEIEGFSRIISHGSAGTGPAWFEVHTKAGQIMEFGHTADSFVPVASMPATARIWAVNKVSDTKGNYFTVSYTLQAANSEAFPARIDYTGNAATGLAPNASVQFSYVARPDVVPLFLGGSLIQLPVLMSEIRTLVGSTVVTDYKLAYLQGTITGRSRLTSVTMCAGDGSCVPPTSFAWAEGKGRSDLMASVTTGAGMATSITYQPMTNAGVYTRDHNAVYPVEDIKFAGFVVSRVDASNGAGGSYSSSYAYAGAKLDVSGRGLLGFRQMTATDLQTNVVQTTNYRQDFPYVGLVSSLTKTLGGATLNTTANSYGATSLGGTRYQVFLAQTLNASYDLDGSAIPPVTTSYQYDAFGNATQVVASTPDGYSKTTTNTYTNDTTNWLLGRLTGATVLSQIPTPPPPPPPLTPVPADLAIAVTHSGSFTPGRAGSYAITVSNGGSGPTIGTVSVTDQLPSGLTAGSLAGTGWSCAPGSLTCTRSDALPAGSSYPPITLAVNVAPNTPSSVTNVAVVSGGGEQDTANDTATDPTNVVPLSISIAAATNNLNLWSYLVANGYASAGQAGSWRVTIGSGVVIGSASTGAYAFDTGAFPAGSVLQITNNGIIVGAGGAGGPGGGYDARPKCAAPVGPPGGTGGPAFHAQFPVILANNGSIWGGGGGGGGGGGSYFAHPGHVPGYTSGGGGGGGAGSVPGAGGGPDTAITNFSFELGSPGTISGGGVGGWGANVNVPYGQAGSGGGPGQPGSVGQPGDHQPCNTGGVGGAAGVAVVGNALVSWSPGGDLRGALQ